MPAALESHDALNGTLLVVAPHMDDEALACGGLIATRPDPSRVFVIYATDGMKSPAPVVRWRDSISPDLGQRRRQESAAAMRLLGVPEGNLHFLCLPEAELPMHFTSLERQLRQLVGSIRPDVVAVPFRYDRHPDHLAVNRAVTGMFRERASRAVLLEYFVYYRSRLLPQRDVRRHLRREHLLNLDISRVAARKRAALDCFQTQTTRFYPWQTRPILQSSLLDEECVGPEQFLFNDQLLPDEEVFSGYATWIRITNRIEPTLVRWKYLLRSWGARAIGREA